MQIQLWQKLNAGVYPAQRGSNCGETLCVTSVPSVVPRSTPAVLLFHSHAYTYVTHTLVNMTATCLNIGAELLFHLVDENIGFRKELRDRTEPAMVLYYHNAKWHKV